MRPQEDLIADIIALALEEDGVDDDITTLSLLDYDNPVVAEVTAKAPGMISGMMIFCEVFRIVDSRVTVEVVKGDGSAVIVGDTVANIRGMESSILRAERTALNFLQQLSGIATSASMYAARLKPYGAVLLDTRKTTPGMRYLQKKAVKDGGGSNHRLNLSDMAMIKDNHIKMAGSITAAVKAVAGKNPGKKIEVEVRNLDELSEALSVASSIDVIMLDNFDLPSVERAVNMCAGRVKIEISGNVTLDNIETKAKTGVDFISVGALTHSFQSLDLSLNIKR